MPAKVPWGDGSGALRRAARRRSSHRLEKTMPTIFDRILAREIPCHRVHEDEWTLAFLDIAPLSPGHTLVVPKEAKALLHELSDDSAAAIGRVLPRICRAVAAVAGTTDCNVLQNNGSAAHQAVMHVHFHVIPKAPSGAGLELSWRPLPAPPDLAGLAAAIRSKLP